MMIIGEVTPRFMSAASFVNKFTFYVLVVDPIDPQIDVPGKERA